MTHGMDSIFMVDWQKQLYVSCKLETDAAEKPASFMKGCGYFSSSLNEQIRAANHLSALIAQLSSDMETVTGIAVK